MHFPFGKIIYSSYEVAKILYNVSHYVCFFRMSFKTWNKKNNELLNSCLNRGDAF